MIPLSFVLICSVLTFILSTHLNISMNLSFVSDLRHSELVLKRPISEWLILPVRVIAFLIIQSS